MFHDVFALLRPKACKTMLCPVWVPVFYISKKEKTTLADPASV